MATPIIQTSFNSGEWAPALYGRVDIQKYHSGAALLRNFFVDYRGGATTRPGTRYIVQAKSPFSRLIPFKASFNVTYVLEFAPGAIRFVNNGAPIIETSTTITAAAAPANFDPSTAHNVNLTNSNQTATNTGVAPNADQGVKVATSAAQTTGKYYYEMTINSMTSSIATANDAIGICTPASLYSNPTGVFMYQTGNLDDNSGFFANVAQLTTGRIFALAVDMTNRRMWIKLVGGPGAPGNWNANVSADPASNVGGAVIPSGSMVPFVSFGGTGSVTGDQFTANFGASSFTGVVPTGFTANWPGVTGGGGPIVFTDTGHNYSNGDWVFVNGSYYIVQSVTTNTFTLTDLSGNPITTNPFTLPVSASRVYTIGSPYTAADLQQIKYVQDVNLLFLCHPNYPPYVLTLNNATNWTLAPINFVPTIAAPGGLSIAVAGTGSNSVSYVITSVDSNGQESSPSAPIQTNVAGNATTQTLSWTAVAGAASYNIYRTTFMVTTTIPGGIPYGFVGAATSNKFLDTNISPDFSQVSPTPENPFQGAGVQSVTITSHGSGYTATPGVTFTAAPGGGITTLGYANMLITSSALVTGGSGFVLNATYPAQGYPSVSITITGVGPGLNITSYVLNSTLILSGSLPTQFGFVGQGLPAFVNVSWSVNTVIITNPGTGYSVAPSVTFSFGGAAATTTLGTASSGNPSVPAMIQQRLFLGGPTFSPAQFNMSQPGAPFNFNVSFPVAPDDAIQATLTSTTLHAIKSALPVSAGLLVFTDQAAWVINGGSAGAPISATQISANPQGYAGSSDLMPIATPTDIIYAQAKNSIVRDLQYNFYLSNYVGVDISVLSSHFFYGYSLVQWAWAEEPFKLVWIVRNDGKMLCLTFLKEQELIAWSSHDTQGQFTSVATVNEATAVGNVDAVYFIVNRTINGVSVPYIERFVELNYPFSQRSAWQVDAGIGYNGPPAVTFSGAQHLGGMAVTGVADGVVINFTMPVSGTFVFGLGGTPGLTGIANASIVTVGLSFLPQLMTLPLDTGEPTIQSKRKKISAVTVRVKDALGLQIGRQAPVAMKDLVVGNIGTMTNTQVTGLVTGDARTIVDPLWDVYGQYLIQQLQPYPATVLAVIPEIVAGDK